MYDLSRLWLVCVLSIISLSANAQQKVVKGWVKDGHNEEAIPYASVVLKSTKKGTTTDSLGFFKFQAPITPTDTLIISYVGYDPFYVVAKMIPDSGILVIALQRGQSQGVVVRTKVNRGLILWRKVVKKKPMNDRFRFPAVAYEIHNKLELDLNRINKEKLSNWKLIKPFGFILDNIDTSEGGPPILPVFLTETISSYYFRKNPRKTREVIIASKTNGINNESVTKLLGGMYQNVNVYANTIPVFDKLFVSPLSDYGDQFYNYACPDTIMDNGRRFFHWIFNPKRKGENTFDGDAWVHDTTFSIQRIQLRLTGLSTINHIENLSIYQDFREVNDSLWFLSKDKFIADVYPIGKNNFGMKGRKTTTYRFPIFDIDSIETELAKNKIAEEVMVQPLAEVKTDSFWVNTRHEALTKTESGIYKMIDTLQQMPLFKKYTNSLYFLTTGYKPIGNYEIGPWFNWISLNAWEGLRTRFDLGTTPGFNKHMYLHGYLAYGFGDQKLKGKAEAYFFLKKQPRTYIHGTFLRDLDNGQNYYDEVSLDNIFTLAVRKPNIPIKFLKVRMQEFEFFASTLSGFSVKIGAQHKTFEPLQNLPLKNNFTNGKGEALNNFETAITLRFAYLERFIDGNFFRTSLGSTYPTVEVQYHKGFSGVLKSNYNYHKISARVNDFIQIAPYGTLDVSLYAGKVYGTLPYMLLNVAPGNEIYYYNKYAFNLMNRFEFITDQYAGGAIEHNFGSGLFKYFPITRRMKLRQFWNIKTFWGDVSPANKQLNFVQGHPFTELAGKAYIEAGTGIDNILKVFRLDFIWRLAPRPLPDNSVSRFGIFGSFRLAF